MHHLRSAARRLFILASAIILSHTTLIAATDPVGVVVRFGNLLKQYVESGDIECRIQLDGITPPNCLVNDVVAQRIAQENEYPAGTLRVADYYNAFEKWKGAGNIKLTINHPQLNKSLAAPGEMSTYGDSLHVVVGALTVSGPVRFEDRVMYFVRNGRITKIISTGDGETLGKGIELYSQKKYDEAFALFRKLANDDISNYMAQYWTAMMLLNGEGCQNIDERFRRKEAAWWLSRGRNKYREFIRSEWQKYCKNNNSDISFPEFVYEHGEDMLENHFPEPLKLMHKVYNEANISKDEFPLMRTSEFDYWIERYRPVTNGLMLAMDETTGLFGFIDEHHDTAIPFIYTYAAPFRSNGYAPVRNEDNKYGFIDHSGKKVIECQYDAVTSFIGNTLFALKDGNLVVLDDGTTPTRTISGYSIPLFTVPLDKYILIKSPKSEKFDMFDTYGNITAFDVEIPTVNIHELFTVRKDGEPIYHFYNSWQ